MDRRKLRGRVRLHFANDPSIYSPVPDYVIDITANTLDLFRGKMDKRTLKRNVRSDVVGTFGIWIYLIWAVRIGRLIAFIWEQYNDKTTATVRARADDSIQIGGDPNDSGPS